MITDLPTKRIQALSLTNISQSFYLQDGGKNQLAQIWNKITSLSPHVYETVERPSVYPSVCLFHRSTAAAACDGFAAQRRADRGYRLTAAGAGTQQQRRHSTAFCSMRGQCHIDSLGTRLNTDLL